MCGNTVRKIIGESGLINKVLPKSSTVRQIADPGGIARQNFAEGSGLISTDTIDPGGYFVPTEKQVKDRQWAAGAPQRAADAALSNSNNALASLRTRRRIATGVTTGAVAGSGQLSSVLAYGKSTLG
jgi:hypothetical protein